MTNRIEKTEQEWQQRLTAEQYRVCRQKGTEQAFTGKYYHCRDAGIYRCCCCEAALFDSDTKFDSGTGWPSFYQPLDDAIKTEADHSLGMRRVEVTCAACDAHLGHVFEDGPGFTGRRYCINSTALNLDKDRRA